jgi:hypothetical protein
MTSRPVHLHPAGLLKLQVMVHTPTTVRAAELQQLHRGLTLPELSLDERLDVLLHVKWAVKEHDCGLSRELVELIDREADLLNRCGAGAVLTGQGCGGRSAPLHGSCLQQAC